MGRCENRQPDSKLPPKHRIERLAISKEHGLRRAGTIRLHQRAGRMNYQADNRIDVVMLWRQSWWEARRTSLPR
jgi:hypothetical protein